jgi:hypothetical protein
MAKVIAAIRVCPKRWDFVSSKDGQKCLKIDFTHFLTIITERTRIASETKCRHARLIEIISTK